MAEIDKNPRATNTSGQEIKEIPANVILGKTPSQWMVHLFLSKEQAVLWYEKEGKKNGGKLWLAQITNLQELGYVPPVSGTVEII